MTPASIIPVFGSQRPYADLNFAGGSFGLDGRSVSDLTALPGFTFTRASLAMGYDATGKLVYGPNNLLTYSQLFSDAAWTKSNSTVSQVSGAEWTLTEAATTARKTLGQVTGGSQLGKIVSIEAKPNGRNFVAIGCTNGGGLWSVYSFNVSTGALVGGYQAGGEPVPTNPVITSLGDGWYRVSVVLTATATTVIVMISNGGDPIFEGYTGNGTSGLLIRKPQLEAVTYQTTPSTYYPTTTAAYYGPRLVYDPVTLASQGILVEEARTNVLTQSNTFTSGTWTTATNITVAAADAVSVDGTTNASRLTDNTTAGVQHRLYRDYTFGSAAAHTLSLLVKRNDHRWMRLFFFDGTTSFWANFDLLSGVVGSKQASTTSRMVSVGNSGWYRVEMTATVAAAVGNVQIVMLASDDTGVPSLYTGTGTSFWAYQAQLEAGTGASSPIPTTTASVTRAADVASLTGISVPAPYSVAAEFIIPRAISSIDITNWGTLANGGGMYTTPNGQAWVRESSVTTANVSGGALSANVAQKMAARYAVNDVNASVNGGIGTADTSVTPPSMSNIGLGPALLSFGGIYPNGTISRIRIYNRALPDAQLQSLTT